jgi:hypothetical protein
LVTLISEILGLTYLPASLTLRIGASTQPGGAERNFLGQLSTLRLSPSNALVKAEGG